MVEEQYRLPPQVEKKEQSLHLPAISLPLRAFQIHAEAAGDQSFQKILTIEVTSEQLAAIQKATNGITFQWVVAVQDAYHTLHPFPKGPKMQHFDEVSDQLVNGVKTALHQSTPVNTAASSIASGISEKLLSKHTEGNPKKVREILWDKVSQKSIDVVQGEILLDIVERAVNKTMERFEKQFAETHRTHPEVKVQDAPQYRALERLEQEIVDIITKFPQNVKFLTKAGVSEEPHTISAEEDLLQIAEKEQREQQDKGHSQRQWPQAARVTTTQAATKPVVPSGQEGTQPVVPSAQTRPKTAHPPRAPMLGQTGRMVQGAQQLLDQVAEEQAIMERSARQGEAALREAQQLSVSSSQIPLEELQQTLEASRRLRQQIEAEVTALEQAVQKGEEAQRLAKQAEAALAQSTAQPAPQSESAMRSEPSSPKQSPISEPAAQTSPPPKKPRKILGFEV